MEFNNNIPIYLQVMNKIKQDIVTGKLRAGDKMMSSRDYSVELGINFNTVARVYKELEFEGVVFTKRGLGTFITESAEKIESIRFEMARDLVVNYIGGMKQIGFGLRDMVRFVECSDTNKGDKGNE